MDEIINLVSISKRILLTRLNDMELKLKLFVSVKFKISSNHVFTCQKVSVYYWKAK